MREEEKKDRERERERKRKRWKRDTILIIDKINDIKDKIKSFERRKKNLVV